MHAIDTMASATDGFGLGGTGRKRTNTAEKISIKTQLGIFLSGGRKLDIRRVSQ